jgi:hypothetical protein
MINKEILLDILKKTVGDRLTKLEKKNNEEESSLKLIKTSFNDFNKRINDLIDRRKRKLEADKELQNKKAKEAHKANKKGPIAKTQRKSNVNAIAIKKVTNDKKNTLQKNKSSANLIKKPNTGRSRGKSVSRLNTDATSDISRNTTNLSRRRTITNKKDEPSTEVRRRNTVGTKRTLKESKSMGKLTNKPTLKKASATASDNNKKKEIEEMQKIVNNITIKNKEEEPEKEKEALEEKEEKKEEPKIEPPPTLMTCHEKGILEKNIIPFLTKSDILALISCNKSLAPLILSKLKDKLYDYKRICDVFIGQTMDDKINSLEVKFTEEDLNAPIKPFEISRGCAKAVGLLDEELYLRVFLRPVQEKTLEDIIIVYKLFCQLLNKEDFVEMKDDRLFWEKFSKFILDNKGNKLSEFFLKCISQFNFDDKNVFKLKGMAKDSSDKLKPAYYGKICGTTGLFVFIIKDSLEYCGAIEDKKTPGSRIKANYLYQKALFDNINKYINFLENIYEQNKKSSSS